jgi:putative PIN family toxin of toxin-antitoxin system
MCALRPASSILKAKRARWKAPAGPLARSAGRIGSAAVVDRTVGIVYNTNMDKSQIVLDTNVIVSALRSRKGASYKLLMLVGRANFETNLSVPVLLEYEDASKRLLGQIPLTENEIDNVLDYLCRMANRRDVYYLWRPFLRDPKDDMILELAVTAQCEAIITYNQRDFVGAEQFGIGVMTPKEFLESVGELK